MQIYDFLKVKKVKCIDVSGMCLSKDKEYQLLGVTNRSCIINDDEGYEIFASIHRFEPVLDNDNINTDELVKHLAVGKNWKEVGCDHIVTITEISSEFANSTMVAFESDCCLSSSPLEMFLKDFEPIPNKDMSKFDTEIDTILNSVNMVNNVIPTFKVGDKVYKYGETDVKTVLEVFEDGYMSISNYPHWVNYEAICHATQENYEMLCKLYPHLEFELPHKRHSEWISVNERLPEPNKLVLVAIHRPQYYVPDFMYITTADYDEVRKKWSSINVVDDLHNVVYWQPFPKIPSPPSEE